MVSLIPKTSLNPKVGDYRPIACCNVIYKVITKIISKRMAAILILPKLVNQAQSAFIPGGSIMDNIYLAQEILRDYMVLRSTPRCAIKIDLRKAYDTISLDFLRAVMCGLKFHPMFVEWVMECISTSSFSIAINSSHSFKVLSK